MKLRRKIASQDFTADMMPQTRKAVFIDVMELHWFAFLKMGLVLLIVYLPILAMCFLQDVFEMRAIADLAEDASAEAIQKILSKIVSLRTYYALLCVPFLILFGVILSGVLRVIRQFAWEEVVFFWRDIWIGIKQNKAQLGVVFAIVGIQNLVGVYLIGSGQASANQAVSMIGTVYTGTTLLLLGPVWAFMCVQISVYSNSFWQNVKLGVALYAKSIVKTLVTLAVLALPWGISLVPNLWCHLIGQAVGIFLLPVALLIWFLYTSALLDKYINPKYFPEIVGKGLHKKGSVFEEDQSSDIETQINEKEDLRN